LIYFTFSKDIFFSEIFIVRGDFDLIFFEFSFVLIGDLDSCLVFVGERLVLFDFAMKRFSLFTNLSLSMSLFISSKTDILSLLSMS
jgi:hypothetical protein